LCKASVICAALVAAWKSVDSERLRWHDVLPYLHYKLPLLEVREVAVEPGSQQSFSQYFLPSAVPTPVIRKMMITGVRARAVR